jgi:hypothetical protein
MPDYPERDILNWTLQGRYEFTILDLLLADSEVHLGTQEWQEWISLGASAAGEDDQAGEQDSGF